MVEYVFILCLLSFQVFTADDWKLITDLLELAFAKTTPIELMNPHRELDFGKAISKVAVHLELIKSLKDICTGETIQYVVQAPKESWTSWLQVKQVSKKNKLCIYKCKINRCCEIHTVLAAVSTATMSFGCP